MINLPNDLATNIASSSTSFLSSSSGLLTLIIGTLLAAVVIEILIGAVRHRG